MSTTAVITQRRAQPPLADEAVATPRATQPVEEWPGIEQSAAGDQPAMTRRVHSATASRSSGAIALVGATVVAGATLFSIGWLWRTLKPAWRLLIYNVEDIRIPVALPVTIGEVCWDFLTDRRTTPR